MNPLTLTADLGSLEAVRAYVTDAAAAAALPRAAANRLRLAVDEIATNIIIHGYGAAGLNGSIEVHTALDEGALTIILEDTAAPFDPTKVPPPSDLHLPPEQRKIGGLGVYLARKEVDEFRYEWAGGRNRNIFIMHRPR
jgi:anti-sigma regulatory factor (Ser/Thr protein kinase)